MKNRETKNNAPAAGRTIIDPRGTEQYLKDSETWYRQFIENQPVGMFRTSVRGDGRFIIANSALAILLGYPSVASLLKRPVIDIYYKPEIRKQMLVELIKKERICGLEVEGKKCDGSPLFISMTLQLIRDGRGNPYQIDGTLEDITARKQAEMALNKRARLHREAQRIAKLGHWELVPDDSPPAWSDEMFRLFEFDKGQFDGSFDSFLDRVHPDDRQLVADSVSSAMQKGTEINHIHRIVLPDGREKYIHAMGHIECDADEKPIRMLGTCQDVTRIKQAEIEREETELKLRQAQKLEAIGTLAGGIAHDFNNILTSMIGFTQLAIKGLPEGSLIARKLDVVLQGGLRARDLVKSILAFSRASEQELKPIRLDSVIKEATKLLRASIPANIEIKQEIDSVSGYVLADPVQVHQIVMNLCTNAYQAIGKRNGRITVLLKAAEHGPDDAHDGFDIPPDSYFHLTIRDTGNGMDQSTLDKVFDPYFTTKKRGEGTGLGLSMVHGIVNDHCGYIFVSSKSGKGTEFHVFLPRIESAGSVASVPKEESMPGKGEHIVVVDDEAEIAAFLTEMLTGLGYRVTPFTDSRQALAFAGSRSTTYDLLLTDMNMPAIRGDALAQRVLATNPKVPVIICTGFSDNLDEEAVKEIGIRACLTKPVMIRELASCIREVLNPQDAKH